MKWRVLAAIVLGYVAVFGVPKIPAPQPAAAITVERPSDEMLATIAPVADALKYAPAGDRLVWAALWSKAALVAAGDAVDTEVVFTTTKSLRGFTVLALRIGWRRVAQQEPGYYPKLRDTVEQAFESVLGMDDRPVTKEIRQRYVDLCRAIAWAGMHGG